MVNLADREEIERFRIFLPVLRAFAGWSLEDVAEMLGVCRTTMMRLENEPFYMKRLQFLALCALFSVESMENLVLNAVIETFEDYPEADILDELREKVSVTRKIVGTKNGAGALKEVLTKWFSEEILDGKE